MDTETEEFIIDTLRRATTKWKGRRLALERVRMRTVIGFTEKGLPKYKYFWICEKCDVAYRDEGSMEVDHIEEIGPYLGDLLAHIKRIYCDQSNLQVLCQVCHQKKTLGYQNARLRYKRKK